MLEERLVRQALSDHGLLSRHRLTGSGARSLRRQGLVVVQPRVVAAVTQPIGVEASMHAVCLSLEPPYAFLGLTALWLHGVLRAPDVVEVGVPAARGLTVHPPVVGRRVAAGLLDQAVVRDGRPVVRLEVAVVQAAAQLAGPELLLLVEDVLRSRRTTAVRLLSGCRRGVAGSSALRQVLRALSEGDLELQQRRLRRAL